MTATKAVVVYNPEAGRLRCRPGLLTEVLARLRDQLPCMEAAPTPGPGMGARVVKEWIGKGADLVCVAGGDGTVNEALEGLAGSGVPLLVLPAGTANVLSREIGTGDDAVRVAARLEEMEAVDVTPGLLRKAGQQRLFLCMAGAGLDARIVRLVKPEWKRRLGKLSYWEGALAQLGRRLDVFQVRVDGRPYECSFALLARVRNYGGDLCIARHANLLKDRLAVVLFEGSSSMRYLKYFAGVLTGQLEGMLGVRLLEAGHVEVESALGAEVDLQVDGEHAGFAPAVVTLGERRVRLLMPRAVAAEMRARAGQKEDFKGCKSSSSAARRFSAS